MIKIFNILFILISISLGQAQSSSLFDFTLSLDLKSVAGDKNLKYFLPDNRVADLSEQDGYLLLMVPISRDSLQITNVTFSNYVTISKDLGPSLENNQNRVVVRSAKYYQNIRYFPIRIYPLKIEAGAFLAPEKITIKIIPDHSQTNYGTEKNSLFLMAPTRITHAIDTKISRAVSAEWRKFEISETGIYKITFTDAQAWGLTESDPQYLHFYSYNGQMLPVRTNTGLLQDIPELAIYIKNHTPDNTWQSDEEVHVYVRGAAFFHYDSLNSTFTFHNNFYNENGWLWIRFDNSFTAPVLSPRELSSASISQNWATAYEHIENDEVNRLKSGTTWYENARNLSDNPYRINIDLPADALCYNCSDPSLKITATLAGGNRYLYNPDEVGFYHYFDFDFENNGSTYPLVSGFRITNASYRKVQMSFALASPMINNALKITYTPVPLSTSGDPVQGKYFFDYYELSYPVILSDYGDQYSFYRNADTTPLRFQFSSVSPGSMIWNVTNASSPSVTEIDADNNAIPPFRSSIWNTYIYVNSVNALSLGDPLIFQYEDHLRETADQADMIIITPLALQEESRQYAETREEWAVEDFKCQVVTVEDIFTEFSGGLKDPAAIRNFLKYAWENRSYRPSFALLIGDGNYDPKGKIFTGPNDDLIPTFQIDAAIETSSYTTDFFYADLNLTSDNPSSMEPEIPLGRLPVSSSKELENYIDKLQNYGQANKSNGWEQDILLIADDLIGGSSKNEIFHFEGAENIYRLIPGEFNTYKLYMELYPAISGGIGRVKPQATSEFLNRVNQGQAIVIYIGHGSPDKWAHESLYDLNLHRDNIQNDYKNGLWMALSCDISKYDDPGRATMGEDLINRQKSGSLWVFASTRLVLAYQNNALGTKIINWLLTKNTKYTIGESITLAVQDFSVANTLKYILFGDPSLPMLDGRIPLYIENKEELDTLKALQKVQFTGFIGQDSNAVIPDISAEAVLRIYDAQDTILYPFNNFNPIPYKVQGASLYKGQLIVQDSRFTASFIVPKSIRYSHAPTGKIWLYAWNPEDNFRASSSFDDIVFFGTAGNISDSDGPEMVVSFNDDLSYVENALIPKDAVLVIKLSDSSGINLSGETGHEMILSVGDKRRIDLSEFFVYDANSATSGELRYPLTTIGDGEHQMKFKAWDNANNPSEFSFSVTVADNEKIELENVVNFPNPMQGETWFTFQTSAASGSVVVDIFTLTGRRIKSLDYQFSDLRLHKIYWDGRDANGNSLANGTYLYKVKMKSGDTTKTVLEKLVILR